MRHCPRRPLDRATREFLRDQQLVVNAGDDVEATWKRARHMPAFRPVLQNLQAMAGPTERCMYCGDSRGVTVEHCYPKRKSPTEYPRRAFWWRNLLLACDDCQRRKGSRFPMDARHRPLLIDPTRENPWDHLVFVPETCELAARYDGAGQPSPKGQTTTDPHLLRLNDQAICEQRGRAWRRIRRAVQDTLRRLGEDETPDVLQRDLVEQLRDADFDGLLEWCLARDG
ncbi:MAG: hypothetical protein IT204_22135 [Fimbriimonadaceae bacterium]|nr:hypothetical protein [Fimbriimonadaceae bacterium]